MNLQTGPTYVLEEVTPARMAFVDNLILEDVDRGILRDNRDEVHRFRCVYCRRTAPAIDLHVGFTQAVLPCPSCHMPAPETSHRRTPPPPRREAVIDFEFFRPLTQGEVDEFLLAATTKAKLIVRALGGDPSDPDGDLRVKLQNSQATRLINGLLVYRDLANTPEGG